MGDGATILARLGAMRKDIASARRDGNHTKALELLISQRELLQPSMRASSADAKMIAPILEKIAAQMEEVRREMHARVDGGEVKDGVETKSSDEGSASAREDRVTRGTATATKTTTSRGKNETVTERTNFEAVDEMLANKTTSAWGVPPPPIATLDDEDDMEILGDADLNRYLEPQRAAPAGRDGWFGAGASKRQKAFEQPGKRERQERKTSPRKSPRKNKNKKGGEPASRWSGEGEGAAANKPPTRFMSAGERLDLEHAAKGLPPATAQYRAAREANGTTRTYGRGGFVPPYGGNGNGQRVKPNQNGSNEDDAQPFSEAVMQKLSPNGEVIAEDILKIDREIVERVVSEILDKHESVDWDSIAGLEHPKAAVQELAVWPMMNPELFVGARAVPKGLLLFGPPGTGKTLIGRAVASQCGATFFSISASSLTSKWIGEGEKMVRALFAVARHLSPAVIFVDEIDSLLSARKSDGEHESSRRMKTEFLVQMDGLGGGENDRLLLIGATNRPQELDDGARRRMPKQLYIPLPCAAARRDMVLRTLSSGKGVAHNLTDADLDLICEKTDGYSGSDMKHLIQEAARAPVRETFQKTKDVQGPLSPSTLRPIVLADIRRAAKQVRPSVTRADVEFHEEWNKNHGALTATAAEDDDDESWD
jgi:SpoVK/Ycf46/Vps4 family AAA+-type ATPase